MASTRELRAAALAPLRDSPDVALALDAARHHTDELGRFLAAERLELLWAEALRSLGGWGDVPARLGDRIDGSLVAATARALAQERLAVELSAALEAAGIEHVVLKGTHLRRELYATPGLRLADDVDVLVAPIDRDRATGALGREGFALRAGDRSPGHARSLERGGLGVDLHWHPFRPGRTRFDSGPGMLAARDVTGPFPVLDDRWTSVMLTVGAALGDYVSGRLLRAVELDRWIRRGRLPWDDLVALTRGLGVATAAWAALAWTFDCLGTPLPPDPLRRLAPGALRRGYLRAWLAVGPHRVHDLSPTVARAGFSLWLEDTPADALRAVTELAGLAGRD